MIKREPVCNGTVWLMTDLKHNDITADMLRESLIPHDNIERYARFLQHSSVDYPILKDEIICNCSLNQFGVDCSYQRTIGSTIEEVLLWQLSRPLERDMGTITCFVDGIQCNAGLLCLEWRDVCNGIVQCEDGIDENDCHLLEFHLCASEEFQCRNGMCIPQEFLFDGIIDCMDKSDEQETRAIHSHFMSCPTNSKFDCDELLCKKSEFSCGDGQCIHWTNVINHQQSCQNQRDAFYRCELLTDEIRYFTLENDLCRSGTGPSLAPKSCSAGLQKLLSGKDR
jgi:hypothetical protein